MGGYRSGVLVMDDQHLMRLDSNGDAVWSKDVGRMVDPFLSRTVMLEDGTIYLSTIDGIVALHPTYDGQSYLMDLEWVIGLDVIFLTAVAAVAWRYARK